MPLGIIMAATGQAMNRHAKDQVLVTRDPMQYIAPQHLLVQIATKYYAVLLRSSKIFVIFDIRLSYAMKNHLICTPRNAVAVMAIIRLRLKK